jgi:hypothetical protein
LSSPFWEETSFDVFCGFNSVPSMPEQGHHAFADVA